MSSGLFSSLQGIKGPVDLVPIVLASLAVRVLGGSNKAALAFAGANAAAALLMGNNYVDVAHSAASDNDLKHPTLVL